MASVSNSDVRFRTNPPQRHWDAKFKHSHRRQQASPRSGAVHVELLWVDALFASLLPGRAKACHQQNRNFQKYTLITYLNAARGGENRGHRQYARKMLLKFVLYVSFLRYASKQTNKHAHCRSLTGDGLTTTSDNSRLSQRFPTFVKLWTPQKFQARVAGPTAQRAPASAFRTPGWARTLSY